MSNVKRDDDLIASMEDGGREVYYVSIKYKIPPEVVRETMLELGKNGKPARSRKKIYARLREKGYEISTKSKVIVPDKITIPNEETKPDNTVSDSDNNS